MDSFSNVANLLHNIRKCLLDARSKGRGGPCRQGEGEPRTGRAKFDSPNASEWEWDNEGAQPHRKLANPSIGRVKGSSPTRPKLSGKGTSSHRETRRSRSRERRPRPVIRHRSESPGTKRLKAGESPGRRRLKGKQPPAKGKGQKLEGKGSKAAETHPTKPKSKFDEPKKGGKGKGSGKPKFVDDPEKLSEAVLAFHENVCAVPLPDDNPIWKNAVFK